MKMCRSSPSTTITCHSQKLPQSPTSHHCHRLCIRHAHHRTAQKTLLTTLALAMPTILTHTFPFCLLTSLPPCPTINTIPVIVRPPAPPSLARTLLFLEALLHPSRAFPFSPTLCLPTFLCLWQDALTRMKGCLYAHGGLSCVSKSLSRRRVGVLSCVWRGG